VVKEFLNPSAALSIYQVLRRILAAGSFLFLLGQDVQVSVQCFIWGEVGEPLHAHRIFENRVSV